MILRIAGGPGTDFAEAFRRIRQIVEPDGITPGRPVRISGDPRSNYIRVEVNPDELTEHQLGEIALWKLSYSGGSYEQKSV